VACGDVPNIEEVREAISDIVRDGSELVQVIARIRGLDEKG